MKPQLRRRFRLFTRKDLFELFVCIALAGLFVLLSSGAAFGQGNVGINNPTPHAKSLLDLTSSDKGLLTPRMTAAQRIAMFAAPDATAKGMLVYQTDGAQGYYYYDGAAWQMLQSGGAGWGLLGNAGTNPATNFIGTTDAQGFAIRTNNTERVSVAQNGKVGIGITSPNWQLDVLDNSTATGQMAIRNLNGTGWSSLNIFNHNLTGHAYFGMHNPTGVGFAGTATASPFALYTTGVPRLHVEAAGNVGIGTQAPATKLHVSAGTAGYAPNPSAVIAAEHSGPAYLNVLSATSEAGLLFGASGSPHHGGLIYNAAGSPNALQVRTGGNVSRMIVSSNGDVTMADNALNGNGARLFVRGYAAAATIQSHNTHASGVSGLFAENAPNTGAFIAGFSNASYLQPNAGLVGTTSAHPLLMLTGNVERARIAANGNMGIGTNVTNVRLHVASDQNDVLANFYNSNSSGWSGVHYDNDGGGRAQIGFGGSSAPTFAGLGYVGTVSAHPFAISTSNVERMRLTADGNVGIGTNAPGAKFEVLDAGSGIVARFQGTTANGYSVAHWLRSDNVGAHVGFFNPGVGGPLAGNFVMGSFGNAPVSLTTNNVERMRIATDGKVGISTAAPTSELEVNGFTKLGSDGPAIKTKKLTGTTAAAQGSFVDVAHGVTGSKILSVQVLVEYAPGAWIPQSYSHSAGYSVNYLINATNIRVYTETGNSANVLGKPMKLLITYEA